MSCKRPDILAIPPLYGRVSRVEDIIKAAKPRATVFMGDYFGQAADADVTATTQWLKKSLYEPDRFHLIGDQDLQYIFPAEFLRRDSFTEEKRRAINSELKDLDWAMLRFASTWETFLFTHAGLQLEWMELIEVPIEDLEDWMDETEEDVWKDLSEGEEHWVHIRPEENDGLGGLTEAIFEELEPIPGWNQVVGHEMNIAKKMELPDSKAVTLNDTTGIDYPDRVMLITESEIWMHSTEALLKGEKH